MAGAHPSGLTAAARAGGVTLAGAYLLGVGEGTIAWVVAGLSLVALARLLVSPDAFLVRAAAVAIAGGALLAGALRWTSLDLAELRGAQAVLGPTVLVGPVEAAAGAWLAVAGAVLALGAGWGPLPRSLWGTVTWGVEILVWALALATTFWTPEVYELWNASSWTRALGGWAAVVASACSAVALVAFVTRFGRFTRVAFVGAGGVAVGVGVALIGSAL